MSVTQHYYDKLYVFLEKFPGILDEFKRNYVIFNQHPGFQEYANVFASSKGALSGLNKDLFTLTNDVQVSIDKLNENSEYLVLEIDELEKENKILMKTLRQSSGTNISADEMNDDAKEEFKYQYLQNITMIFGNIFLILIMFKIFKK